MPGIHFDFTADDSPFYASADRIVRRINDMSKVVENVGKNVSFAPLLNNLEKLMKDISLSGDAFNDIKGKLNSTLTAISNSTDSVEKKQQKFKDAIVEAFSMIATSVESELGASRTVLNNFYAELDVVMEGIKKNSADIIDVDAIREKAQAAAETFAQWTNPEERAFQGTNPDTGEDEIRYEKVDEAIKAIREKALEDVRTINSELQTLVANLGDGSVEQVQNTLTSLKPLEDRLNAIYNSVFKQRENADYGSDEWNEATEKLNIYQKALDQVKTIKDAISEQIPNNAEAEALKQQAAELEELISMEETAVEKLQASKAAIEESINAASTIGQADASGSVSERTPQVYMTQEEYENVKRMREEIENLQNQISQFDGSEEELTALKEKLSDTNDQLREAEMTAIETAAAYGDRLGTKASAVSEHLYEMNVAVEEQKEKIAKLTDEFNKAADAVTALDGSTDTDARQKAINEYEQVAQALHQAQAEMVNLEVEQQSAKNAWTDTTAEMERYDSVLVKLLGGEDQFREITSRLPEPLQGAVNGLTGMTGAAKAFIATPLGAVLAALILAWQALNTWFERSEEGQLALAKITGYLSGVMETLKDVVATVGEIIYKAFTEPKKAISEFGSFLWSQVTNRVNALGQIFGSLGNLMKNVFTGNWSEIPNSLKDMANAWLQFGTGIEKPIDKAVNAISTLNKKAKESANIAVEEKQLQREEAKTKKLVAEYDNRAKQLEAKGKRRTAAEDKELKALQKKMSDAEKSIIDKKIELQERAMANGKYDTIEDQNKLDELYAQRENLLGKEAAKQERLRSQEIAKAKKAASESAARNAKQLQDQWKHEQEMADLEEKAARAREDASIAAIQSQAERERKEREAQHRRTIEDLKSQEKDIYKAIYEQRKKAYETANKGKNYENTEAGNSGYKAIDYDSLTAEEKRYYDERYNIVKAGLDKENAEYARYQAELIKQQAQFLNEYIKEYGSIAEKRAVIEEEYRKKMSEATSIGEKLTLQTKMEVDLQALDSKELADRLNFEDVFNNLEVLTVERMKAIRDELRSQLSSNNLGFEEYKVLAEQIEKINTAILDKEERENEILGFRIPGERTVKRLKEEQAEAMKDSLATSLALAEATLDVDRKRDEISKLLSEGGITFEGKITAANSQKILEQLGLKPELRKKVEAALLELGKAENKATEATKKKEKADGNVVRTSQTLKEALGNVRERVGEFAESFQQINANLQSLPGLADTLGFGVSKEMQQGLDGINDVMGGMADFASGNYVGAAMKGISAIKNFGSALGIIGGQDNHEQMVELQNKYTRAIESTTQALNRMTNQLEKSYGAIAIDLSKEAVSLIKKNLESEIKGIDTVLMDRYGGGEMDYTKYNRAQDVLLRMQQYGNAYGMNLYESSQGKYTWQQLLRNNAEDVAKMFKDIRDSGDDLWQIITQQMGYNEGQLEEWINKLIDTYDQFEETDVKLKEQLTTTTEDNVFDDFLNSLYDLADGSEDVTENIAENWQKMVNRMVINNLIVEGFREDLKEWYDDLADLNQRLSDGNISEVAYNDQLNALGERYNTLIDGAQKKIEDFKEKGFIKPIGEATAESKKYFEDLAETWKSSLSDMTKDTEAWKQELLGTILSDLVDSTVLTLPVTVSINGQEQVFDGYEKYLQDWTGRYKAIIENQTLTDEQRNEQLKALVKEQGDVHEEQLSKTKELAEGIGYEIGEDTKNAITSSLDNLGDTLLDNLLNAEESVADMGKKIAMSLIKEMLQTMLASETYAGEMQAIKELWQDILTGKDTEHTREDVLNQIAALTQRISEDDAISDLAAAYRELDTTVQSTSNSLDNLAGTLLDSLLDTTTKAGDIGKKIGVSLVKEMLQTLIDDKYAERIAEIRAKWQRALESESEGGRKRLMASVQRDIAQLEADMASDAQIKPFLDMNERLTASADTTYSEMADSFVSSLMDMERTAEDWATDIGKTMAQQIIRQMVVPTMIQPLLDNLQGVFDKAVDAATVIGKDGGVSYDWHSIINDRGLSEAVSGIKAQYPEIQSVVTQIMSTLGVDTQTGQETPLENPFKDMVGTFVSALMDMEKSAEDFASDVSRMLTEKMIERTVTDRFQQQIEDIGWEWQQALDTGNSAAIERITEKLKNLEGEMAEAVRPLLDGIREVNRQTDDTFSSMTDSWVSALMNMEGKAEEFAENVGRTMAQKIITQLVAPIYIQPVLDKLQEAFDKAIAVEGATISSVVSTLSPFIGEIEDVYNQIMPIRDEVFQGFNIYTYTVEEAVEEVEYALGDMKSNFTSALMDMSNTAEDFSSDISKVMAQNFIENFVLGQRFDQQMEYWQRQYEGIISGGYSGTERKKQLKQLRDTIAAAKEGYVEEARAIQELLGVGTVAEDKKASVSAAEKITYDQADEMTGILRAIQIAGEQRNDILRGMSLQSLGAPMQALPSGDGAMATSIIGFLDSLKSLSTGRNPDVTDIRNMMISTNEYLLNISNSHRKVISTFGGKLDVIIDKLDNL